MDLPSLDLNLIVVLHALLEERNVTRAGERLGLSQPGTSSALARLRRHFNDRLLERVGNQYVLTPLAQGLAAQVGRTVRDFQSVLTATPTFDPATTDRQFVIVCSDSVLSLLGPRIITAVVEQAPGVKLDFRNPGRQLTLTDPLGVLEEVDVLILPHGVCALPDVPCEHLYHDRWVCVASTSNTSVGDRLSLEELARARWVLPFHEVLMASPADAALAMYGINRNDAVRVECVFTVLGQLVAGTSLLALLHGRTADNLAAHGLRAVQLPVDLPPIIEVAWSHPNKQLDPGHRWLIDRIVGAASELEEDVPDITWTGSPSTGQHPVRDVGAFL